MIKVFIWRVISILLTLLVTFLMTGDVKTATNMTILLHTVLIMAHFSYEMVWLKYEDKRSKRR